MHRRTFDQLCQMLDSIGGLKPINNVAVDEQVAICVHILAHPVKDRVIRFNIGRSGETVSRYFSLVLNAIMELYEELSKKPEPVPEDSTDEKWKWFKFFQHCLGAVDCAYIKVKVPLADQGRYRNRKGEITTNVLGACSQDGQFTFIFPGWEGSATNRRVLCDAVSRRHGFKVPHGQYYLVDGWFTSCEGFLAPYKGKRYRSNQLREEHYPGILHECYNTRHSLALDVIKRCFGLLKLRWAILRNPPFFKAVRTYNLVIFACCLLQNLIRQDGADPLEDELADMEGEIFNELIGKSAKR
ncbi:uncharacterized protein LOC129297471 isoform X1 [Prosopis cineraria]|uniref:uncharacterized protein LOC129297471 isoform X1 n=1 Tax=Prosopis cineraria TaxID=364024 RepID=UPI00240ED51D|nr:uncharacterized protein LOC129297471 isoform X1 [Prosopis cineraria]